MSGTTGLRGPGLPGLLAVLACALVLAASVLAKPARAAGTFWDVTESTPHESDVAWLSDEGISTGWERADGTREFRPYACVARADMAAFLYRLAGSPSSGSGTSWQDFADVTPKTSHYTEIMWLSSTGISEGWTNADWTRSFRPYANVARADMAAFLYRLAGSPSFDPSTSGIAFRDVTARTPHYTEIMWLASTGVSEGWERADGTREFRPYASVARCDMAAFLHRMAEAGLVSSALPSGGSGMTVAEAIAEQDTGSWGAEATRTLVSAARAAGATAESGPVKVEGRWITYDGHVLKEERGRFWEAAKAQGVSLYQKGSPAGLYASEGGQVFSGGGYCLGDWTYPRYAYSPYLVRNDASGTTLYSGMTALVYLRTDNAQETGDPSLKLYDKTYHRWVGVSGSGWDDVPGATGNSGRRADSTYKVEGGILVPVSLYYYVDGDDGKPVQRPMEAGTHEIVIYEQWNVRRSEPDSDGVRRYDSYYAVGGSFTLDVTDSAEAEDAWMQAVLDACTTPSMSPLEKMGALETYLRGDGQYAGFTYSLVSSDDTYLSLARRGSSIAPYFVVRRWDSYSSPAVLCAFANRIGGFDEVHNCYFDYARGTTGWYQTHYYCRVTYQGEQRYFYVCPSTSTGRVDSFESVSFAQGSPDLVAIS